MHRFILILAFILGGFPAASAASVLPADAPRLRVLFIGNSYTHGNELPHIITQLFAARGTRFEYEMIAPGGTSLDQHWQAGAALAAIRKAEWAYVVLQDQSLQPVRNREGVLASVALFAPEIRQANAQPVLYQTWPRQSRPEDGLAIIETYRLAAEASQALVVPAGVAWASAVEAGIEPYYDDGSHPNRLGSYLIALQFYRTLSGAPAVGLPLSFRTAADEPATGISEDEAQRLQILADQLPLIAPGAAPR